MKKTSTLAGLACLGLTGFASAALISPSGISLYDGTGSLNNVGNTFLENVDASHEISHTFDGSGIGGLPIASTTDLHDPYNGGIGGRIRNAPAGGGGNQASIQITFGGPVTLDGLALWNGNENDNRLSNNVGQRDKTGRGIASAVVFTSTDNGTTWDPQGTFNFTREFYDFMGFDPSDTPPTADTAGATGSVSAQLASWTEVSGVTDVRLDLTNHGGGNIINFNEIAFVPEPSTSLLGALGLGLLVVRRRR